MKILASFALLAVLFGAAPTLPTEAPYDDDMPTLALRSAEGVYRLPFASENNRIELAIANTSQASIRDIRVRITNAPPWLTIAPQELTLNALRKGAESRAVFTFSVAETAPVAETHLLAMEVTSANGVRRTKEIHVEVEAPQEVQLHPNYPNPFNPTTTIGYVLPGEAHISLHVYNVLGQEVAVLADRRQPAGYRAVRWEAGSSASGLYLYRLVSETNNGHRTIKQNKMLLMK